MALKKFCTVTTAGSKISFLVSKYAFQESYYAMVSDSKPDISKTLWEKILDS